MAWVTLGTALLAACGDKVDTPSTAIAASGPAKAAAGPAVPVTTVRARQQDFAVMLQAIGTVAPVASVDVKPQVTSVVTKVLVTEGQFVRAGQPLFELDSRSDEANVAKMRAQMAKDQASLADARRSLSEQESTRGGDERNYQRVLDRLKPFQEAVEVHEKNIASIKREMANLR